MQTLKERNSPRMARQVRTGKVQTYDMQYTFIFILNKIKLSSFSEPLGGVKNLQVTDPTTSSLKVRWEPAEGNVRQYRIFYVPASGGAEDMVRDALDLTTDFLQVQMSIKRLCVNRSKFLEEPPTRF